MADLAQTPADRTFVPGSPYAATDPRMRLPEAKG